MLLRKTFRSLRPEVLIGFNLIDLTPLLAERLYSKAGIGSKGLRITSRIRGQCLPRGFQDLIGFPREEEVVGDRLAQGFTEEVRMPTPCPESEPSC